jgi:hypothetical protein
MYVCNSITIIQSVLLCASSSSALPPCKTEQHKDTGLLFKSISFLQKLPNDEIQDKSRDIISSKSVVR